MNLVRHWQLRMIGAVLAAAALNVDAKGNELASEPDATQVECKNQCGSGSGVSCPSGEHKAWASSADAIYGGVDHSDCWDGTCTDRHYRCPIIEGIPDADPTSLLDEVLTRQDVAGTVRLVEQMSTAVQFNKERQALQVLDCSGGVVAHIPVSEAYAEALERTAAPR